MDKARDLWLHTLLLWRKIKDLTAALCLLCMILLFRSSAINNSVLSCTNYSHSWWIKLYSFENRFIGGFLERVRKSLENVWNFLTKPVQTIWSVCGLHRKKLKGSSLRRCFEWVRWNQIKRLTIISACWIAQWHHPQDRRTKSLNIVQF